MKSLCVVACLLSSVAAVRAADEYYVVQDVGTKRCEIVESPPSTTDQVLIDNGSVFFARHEAEQVLAGAAECTSRRSASANPAGVSLDTAQAAARASAKAKVRVAAKKSFSEPPTNPAPAVQQDPLSSLLALFR
jgi:hypothetical protein